MQSAVSLRGNRCRRVFMLDGHRHPLPWHFRVGKKIAVWASGADQRIGPKRAKKKRKKHAYCACSIFRALLIAFLLERRIPGASLEKVSERFIQVPEGLLRG